ncbi:MAG: acyl-CoA desaturase [Acidimicrobiales bacterium]|nr:acyl-CoA desaturase [Acidimicrobiales bacterium]
MTRFFRSLGAVRIGSLRLGTPFVLVHVVALVGPFLVGVSWAAVATAFVLYIVRVFGITAFFHRGLAHRAFTMGRGVQFVGAALGTAAAQQGPLWWAAHHRVHHRFTDKEGDLHSPRMVGFWQAHMGWVFQPEAEGTKLEQVRDLARYRELRWLDEHPYVVPALLGVGTWGWGVLLASWGVGTSGAQMVIWGWFVSTTLLYHATFLVNSLAHIRGSQPFDAGDDSRNNAFVALVTIGEGWHNNHHRFPRSARMGFGRRQPDPTWMVLKVMERLRLISDLRGPNEKAIEREQERLAA